MTGEDWPNLATMFFEQAAQHGARPFLWAKRDGAWRPQSWREVAAETAALARALKRLGVGPGDRIVLVSENRPEWLIADVAIMAIGAISVPAYTTNQTGNHLHILTDSGATGAVVSTGRLAEKLLPAARAAPELDFVIAMEPPALAQDIGVAIHGWDELLAGDDETAVGIAAGAKAIARTDTACIIYTSGTGGVPKGVMLSHGAILSNCTGARTLLRDLLGKHEVFLSFLPLSHSYEHTAGQFLPIAVGAEIYYAEGVDKLAANMGEVHPTLMTAVPRLYESMHGRILHDLRQGSPRRQRLFMKAVELGRRKYQSSTRLGTADRVVDLVCEILVRRRVRKRFGGRLKALVSGGAPLNTDIGMFFTALGLRLLQGYGLTESAPVVSCNPPERVKIDTVGPPLENVEVRIADDGEILVQGELLMQGYWNNVDATNEAIRDGWLHTGDIGEIDADGYLRITDRKKDIIVNSGGDNIAPQRIEGMLTLQPEIAQAMVFGDRRPHIVALVVPDETFAQAWAEERGMAAALDRLVAVQDFQDAVGAAVARVNHELSVVERVRRFTLATAPFTVENELLTPTLKIRRHKIVDIYRGDLDALYGS